MSFSAEEAVPRTIKFDHTTSTFVVSDDAGMDSSLAKEGVSTVDRLRDRLSMDVLDGSTNDEGSVIDFLISNGMRIQNFDPGAIGGTSEGKGRVMKGATLVAVQATSIVCSPTMVNWYSRIPVGDLPITGATPYGRWCPVSLDISSRCRVV